MTTTTLTSYASTYAVGRQQVHFDVRSSTPTSGAMNDRDAQGYWWVKRGGAFISPSFGTLDFGWLGLDGDEVHARAVDSAGNMGDWETYTYSVADNTAADVVRYVNGSTGDNGNSGTSAGDAWATLTYAVTQVQAALTVDGQVGVIFVAGGQTYTESTQPGSDTATNLIRVVWDGTGGSEPHIDFPLNNNGFNFGLRFSWHLEGLDMDGNDTQQQVGVGVNFSRSSGTGASDRRPYNAMVVDCILQGWGNSVTGEDTGPVDESDRDSGIYDYVALQDVTFNASNSVTRYGIFGMGYCDKWLFRDLTFTGTAAANYTAGRLYSLGRGYCKGFTINTSSTTGRLRLLPGPTTDNTGAMRLNTWEGITHLDAEFGSISLETDSGEVGLSYVEDVRFLNCLTNGLFELRATEGGVANMVVPTRLDIINLTASGSLRFDGDDTSGGVMQSVRIRGCGVSRSYQDQNFLELAGNPARYASGCFSVESSFIYWGMTSGFDGGGKFVNGETFTRAQLADKLSVSDYNHMGKVNGTMMWFAGHPLDGGGSRSLLSEWQSNTVHDDNSSVTNHTTFSLTNDGYPTSTDIDLRLTDDTGPLSGAGVPLAAGVAIDGDNYLRDATTPDAGPFEYAASTQPDEPPAPEPAPEVAAVPRTPPGGADRAGPHAPDARRTKGLIRKFGLNRKPPVKPSRPPQSVKRAIKKPPSRPSKLPRSLRGRFGR